MTISKPKKEDNQQSEAFLKLKKNKAKQKGKDTSKSAKAKSYKRITYKST